jgi:hypothetical protein
VEKSKVMRISREPVPFQIMIHQKQLQYVEYLNYLGGMISDAICIGEIKYWIAMAKAAFSRNIFSPANYI